METRYADDVNVPMLKLAGWDTLAGSLGYDSKGYRWLNSVSTTHSAMNKPEAPFRRVDDTEIANPALWCPREYRRVVANHRYVDIARTASSHRVAAGR